MPTDLWQQAHARQEQIRTWRRQIHQYPELSFEENQTAALVKSVLDKWGIETQAGVAKTGLVGTIRGGEGPVVGLRADMDALPITEQNGSDFDSTRPGLMHACGHDAHTAMALGAATLLQELADRGQLPGTVRLLFQPSEEDQDDEGQSGAMRMLAEGSLEGLTAIFGLHVDPALEVGTVATRVGPLMAGVDDFTIKLYGSAAHAARPHQGIDTIALAAHLIQAVHQVVSRRLDPIAAGVITIGTIQGGTKANILADRVTMKGTIRSFTPESRRLLQVELERACRVVEPLGGQFELDQNRTGYPPLVNAPEPTQAMISAAGGLLGAEQVLEAEPMMSAEDFSFMAQAVPACFMRLGVHNPAWERRYFVHTPTFRLDEAALPIGAATLAAAVLAWLQKAA